MSLSADQIFVWLKHWLLNWLLSWTPEAWQPWISIVLSIAPIILVFALLFAIVTVLERKGLGRIQNRPGPNRVGPAGFLQFAADGIKAIIKEDVVPAAADRVVHFLAPFVLVVPILLAYSVLPVGRNMVAIDLDAGVLFFFAAGAATELSPFLAGWSSRNKYSLLGAMRAIAQMISYELPLVLATIPVIMLAGSLSTVTIVDHQSGFWWWSAPDGDMQWYWLPKWNVLKPWGLAGFILFMIAATAESNRSPFDLPEGESEIIAGYFVEYSGFKFALFFLGEYLGLFAVSGLGITLFLGGWQAPCSFLTWVPSWIWFFAKLLVLIAVFIWVRGTIPRLRMDQLMNFAWKFLLPLTLINILAAGVWKWLPHPSAGLMVLRWLICATIIFGAYWLLGRAMTLRRNWTKRTYRFAS